MGTKVHAHLVPGDMMFAKDDASKSDVQVEELMQSYNLHYRCTIGALIYLTAMHIDISFAIHKPVKFSANPGKVHLMG